MTNLKHFLNSSIPHLNRSLRMQPVDYFFVDSSFLTAFLSFFSCITIWGLYFLNKDIRTTSRLLLVFLSLANLIACFATFLQVDTYMESIGYPDQSRPICQVAAGLWVFSQVSVALWTCAVTFYLFLCVSCKSARIANRIVFMFHIFCWLMPAVVASSASVSGVFGYDVSDLLTYDHPTPCWISDRVSNPVPWYLITAEGWVIAAFFFICILYIPITLSIFRNKRKGKEITGDEVIEELAIQTSNQQLRYIPAIYVATRIWGTVYFLFTRYPVDRHLRASDWLMVMKGIGDNSQGLMNAIYFCFATKSISTTFCKTFSKCCRCFNGWCRKQKQTGRRKWMKLPSIVKTRSMKPRRRTLDGSDLDISGISLDMPHMNDDDVPKGEEDEVIFER